MPIYKIDNNSMITETVVYKDKGGKCKHPIAVYPDPDHIDGFIEEPYFKYFQNQNTDASNQILLRIRFEVPEFVVHHKMRDAWDKFNAGDKKELIEILNKKVKSKQDPDIKCRVWDNMLYQLAFELTRFGRYTDYNDIKDWPIPDYTKLPTIER